MAKIKTLNDDLPTPSVIISQAMVIAEINPGRRYAWIYKIAMVFYSMKSKPINRYEAYDRAETAVMEAEAVCDELMRKWEVK